MLRCPPSSFETRSFRPLLRMRAALGRGRASGRGLARAVAQHEAGAAGATNAAAQALRRRTCVGADAHLVEWLRAAAAQNRAEQARVAPGENLAVALGERRVARQRLVAREAGAKLYAPRRHRDEVHALLELLHERIGRAVEKRHQLAAAGLGDRRRLALAAP